MNLCSRITQFASVLVLLASLGGSAHALSCTDIGGTVDPNDPNNYNDKVDAQLEAMMAPFRAARDLLATTPGIGQLAAAGVICGIGADVREFFPDAAHLASWTGLCPGNHESAGKHRTAQLVTRPDDARHRP